MQVVSRKRRNLFRILHASATANARDFRFFTAMQSLTLVMSGSGQGHVSNFYIVDLEISPQSVTHDQTYG